MSSRKKDIKIKSQAACHEEMETTVQPFVFPRIA